MSKSLKIKLWILGIILALLVSFNSIYNTTIKSSMDAKIAVAQLNNSVVEYSMANYWIENESKGYTLFAVIAGLILMPNFIRTIKNKENE